MTRRPFIRRARPDEAAALSEVARAAKRHWGYPPEWMLEWREALTITPAVIAERPVYVAEAADDVPVAAVDGFYALLLDAPTAVLEHLWVRPPSIGRGVGRALLDHARERASAGGASELRIDSDPHAEGFCLRMGARRVGEIRADVGDTARQLPRLVLTL